MVKFVYWHVVHTLAGTQSTHKPDQAFWKFELQVVASEYRQRAAADTDSQELFSHQSQPPLRDRITKRLDRIIELNLAVNSLNAFVLTVSDRFTVKTK
jgi:hypothetical protein